MGPQYVWCLTAKRNHEKYPRGKYYRFFVRAGATATFETGPMARADWHNASWLVNAGQFRRAFDLDLPAGSAVARVRSRKRAVKFTGGYFS